MREPVPLPLSCPYCGGAVEVQFRDFPTDEILRAKVEIPTTQHTWTYPYCQKQNSGGFPGGFPGKIAWVTKGHAETKARH